MSDSSEAKSNVIEKLNERQPQHPPDVYFIRRNKNTLRKYLNDPSKLEELQQ